MFMHAGAYEGQKRVLKYLEMELHVVLSSLMWVMGTERRYVFLTVETRPQVSQLQI